MHIPTICLTGGPCAGKTTILSFLQQKLVDFGFTVVTVTEAATEFISSGLTPDKFPNDFQKEILKFIIEKEERWKHAASLMNNDRVVLICDRGTMDGEAYVSREEFAAVFRELGATVVDLRDKRYDAVIFLRSVAVDSPEYYTLENNKARRETIAEACALDAKTEAAWIGHPHMRVISNIYDLQGKMNRALQTAYSALGIPVPLEIEKKYIVSDFTLDELKLPTTQVQITQHYLQSRGGDGGRIRARKQGDGVVYYHTLKEELRPGVRREIERQISEAEYLEMLHFADPHFGVIEKTRNCFVWENQYFELDIFQNPDGLVLLEIELTSEQDEVTLPDFLQGRLIDVTGDVRYTNRELARKLV